MALRLHNFYKLPNPYNMQLKYFKTQWRIIRTRKIYYFVNVLGLAFGIASSILILLWIVDELGYETMHKKSAHIQLVYKQYRMGDELEVNDALPMPLGPTLKTDFPEISKTVRVVQHSAVVRYGENIFNEQTMCAADLDYFEIFSFQFIQGDPAQVFSDPYSIVLSREKAIKYFGEVEVLGEVLELDNSQEYTVTGVIENITSNTALDYDMVLPLETIYKSGSEDDSWFDHFLLTYIYLDVPIKEDSLNARLTRHARAYMGPESTIELIAQPIRESHLNDLTVQTPRQMYIYIFSIIGFLVLLIACINFTNVSIIVSLKRSREIGVKKINGGGRARLVSEFLGETFHQTILGFIGAMTLVELLRKPFNQLTGKSIHIPYLEPWFFGALAGLILLTTLLAGSYPALLISAFKPIDAFQGRINSGKGQARFRTFLLVFQFAISVGLIISTLTIFSQLRFMQSKNLGFDKENLVYLPMEASRKNYDVFRDKLLSHSKITSVCRTSSLPTSIWNKIRGLTWEGGESDEIASFAFVAGDEDFVKTMGFEILSGRDFSREYSLDSTRILVTEAAAKMMGFEDPVGGAILSDSTRIEIVGLVKDFHGTPLTYKIEPMLIALWPEYYLYTLVRIQQGNPEETLEHISSVWKSMYPGIPFDLKFVDERINQQYRSESRIGKLAGTFTLLAILITCIGLFAIAGHTAQRKDKEIGIRKAMGATSHSVILHFIALYLKWVILANVIAWPVSWILMKNWLDNFAYRTGMNIWAFLMAVLITTLISVLTIGWHAWSMARADPIHALRCE